MHPNHTGIVTACEGVAVPARGAGCIEERLLYATTCKCCRPREGCGLHPAI